MHLNKAVIPHYRAAEIPLETLKKRVSLNEEYLKEKPTWYDIEGKLQYFKKRNDFRLFTEQFFSMFGREILGLDTLDYRVAYVRTIDPVRKTTEEKTDCGLLSENFQTPDYNYYLISELFNPQISSLVAYGEYSLRNLLAFFKDILDEKSYEKIRLVLVTLFVADGFTHQEDRNIHNICTKIPKIEGIPYTKRLQPEVIRKHSNAKGQFTIGPDGQILLTNLDLTKIYDNERTLGTDHKNVVTYYPGQVWCPEFPYSEETLFKQQADALAYQNACDGLDPNLLGLYLEHSDICTPIFERLAYDSEYRKILERFEGDTCQIVLTDKSEERIIGLFEDKQKMLKRILKI